VTPEDYGELRALERFIGRGIVRKKAEGFNYSQAAPASNPADEERRFPRGQNQNRAQRSGQPSHAPHHGGQPQRQQRPGRSRWRR
jgi:ATP-dependent RNA helicase RhlE